jgi:prepilin-type N-terminal cleavage/methylation domain-containing protein
MGARSDSKAGFTLVELMIVVGIIGLLSAIAIPNFISYQARSRRSEAYVNLAAVGRIQNSYHAERGEFFESGAWPDFGDDLSTRKMQWDAASEAAYADLGWRPEGQVFYAYDTNTGATACTCELCFTATAAGDVDDDDLNSAVMYVHPERTAEGVVIGECPSGLFGFGTPIDSGTGQPVYDRVAVQRSLDQY